VAADIGGVAPHVGRGGWTWYTGAAAWIWRFGIEQILGLRLHQGELLVDPCLPPGWDGFEAQIRGPAGTVSIRLEDPQGIGRGPVEGKVAFPTDGSTRRIELRLGARERDAAGDTEPDGSS
jgi:cyclic beta-1,2-glucan synthetase